MEAQFDCRARRRQITQCRSISQDARQRQVKHSVESRKTHKRATTQPDWLSRRRSGGDECGEQTLIYAALEGAWRSVSEVPIGAQTLIDIWMERETIRFV